MYTDPGASVPHAASAGPGEGVDTDPDASGPQATSTGPDDAVHAVPEAPPPPPPPQPPYTTPWTQLSVEPAPVPAPAPGVGEPGEDQWGDTRTVLLASVVAFFVALATTLVVLAITDDDPQVAAPVSTDVSAPPTTGASTLTPGFDLQAVIDAVGPSVVTVRTGVPAGDGSYGFGAGAGVVIDDTTIVTTHRVVERVSEDGVSVVLADGSTLDVDVLGRLASENLAVLALRGGATLTPAPLGSSPSPGDPVVALGDAITGPGGPTPAPGVVTSTGQSASDGVYELDGLIQTDATVTPGNAGGALASSSGQVVGILTAMAPPGQGTGYAIPIETAREAVERIRSAATTDTVEGAAFLGVTVVNIDDLSESEQEGRDVVGETGPLVVDVADGSPADEGGLLVGDIIRSIGGTATADREQVAAAVAVHRPGELVEVEVQRASDELVLEVVLGSAP